MMTARDASSENDVLYRFAMHYQHPDPDQLEDYVRRHPAYADALTTLAIELATEQAHGNEEAVDVETYQPDSESDAMLSRAMSCFQNQLYQVQTRPSGVAEGTHSRIAEATSRELFGQRTPAQMQALREKLDVSPLFLKRLRDREIRADTIPSSFVRLVAAALEVIEEEVIRYLWSQPQIAVRVRFKSDVMPTVGEQIAFEDAVRSSGLTLEQQARLLAP